MNKDPKTLASRQEMMKVQPDYIAQADSLDSVEALRTLYTTAKANNAPQEVLERLKDRANQLTASEAEGTGRGVSNSKVQGKRK